MKDYKGWPTGFLILVGVLAVTVPAVSSKTTGKPNKLVVIVKSDGALAGLGPKDIPAIYLGDKQFQNGDRIEPLVNGGDSLAEIFMRKVLDKTKAQYKKIWSGKAFIDGVSAPPVLPSSGDVIREVEKNGDAIGFVADKDIADATDLKVVYSVDASK